MSAASPTTMIPTPEAAKVPDATLKAVATNVVRHLCEADQHYKAARFASATSSAVLCIEEAGKLAFLLTQGSVPKRGDKHVWNSILFIALASSIGSWDCISEWRTILRCEEDPTKLDLTSQQQQAVADHSEVAEFVRRVQGGELPDRQARLEAFGVAFAAKEVREGKMTLWEPYIKRGLQLLRLKATYADGLCIGATCFMSFIIVLVRAARPSIDVTDLGEISDDVIGMDTVRQFCNALVAAKARESATV
jgi:AbiV